MQAGGLSVNWMKSQLCLYEQELAKTGGGSAYDYINKEIELSLIHI